jgi:hypothetical protein
MNEQDLRDCFAMFALNGILGSSNGDYMLTDVAETAYSVADAMLEARKPQETVGLPAIKKRVRK